MYGVPGFYASPVRHTTKPQPARLVLQCLNVTHFRFSISRLIPSIYTPKRRRLHSLLPNNQLLTGSAYHTLQSDEADPQPKSPPNFDHLVTEPARIGHVTTPIAQRQPFASNSKCGLCSAKLEVRPCDLTPLFTTQEVIMLNWRHI